jgi:hypothetical protein
MKKNLHIINFNNLKKFIEYIEDKNNSNCKTIKNCKQQNIKSNDDQKIFGSAYHKILEEPHEKLKSIAKNNSIIEINKLLRNFSLSDESKKILLKMIRKFYESNVYQKLLSKSFSAHSEQNICHFIMKDGFLFRLESIVDCIIHLDSKKKIIIDYKTIDSLSSIEKNIKTNLYWFQLLFYKYVFEGSVKNNKTNSQEKIFDIYLIFQSKSPNDNFEIELKKFSDLSEKIKNQMMLSFENGIKNYISFILEKNKTLDLSKKSINNFLEKKNSHILNTSSKYLIKTGFIFSNFWAIIMHRSNHFLFGKQLDECCIGCFLCFSIWIIFAKK